MEQSPKNVTVLDGKDATIVCRAVGAPAPNITWMYNGKLRRRVDFTQQIFTEFCLNRRIDSGRIIGPRANTGIG